MHRHLSVREPIAIRIIALLVSEHVQVNVFFFPGKVCLSKLFLAISKYLR